MLKLSEIVITPEEYERNILECIPEEILQYSEMHPCERYFVNGLIRLMKPKRILELGVAEGGGSAVLLNAISDMPDSTVTSVDFKEKLWNDSTKVVGFATKMFYPNGNRQWELYSGKDFSDISASILEPFDFCIIDTAHAHPIESLNFLTALPFLSDGSVVVFHDLALYAMDNAFAQFPNSYFANKLAYDTIVGEKLKPQDMDYLRESLNNSNIGAVQISNDTRKYIANVFDMLMFPWPRVVPCIKSMNTVIKNNYSNECYDRFCSAVITNTLMINNNYRYTNQISPKLCLSIDTISCDTDIILYGAGHKCEELLLSIRNEHLSIPYPSEIWDISPEATTPWNDIPIFSPKFEYIKSHFRDSLFVVTIENKDIVDNVVKKILSNHPTAKVITMSDLYSAESIRACLPSLHNSQKVVLCKENRQV